MKNYIYIFIMFFVTFLIRIVPISLIRREIKSKFLKSFLYYVPYVTLSLMTFPAILTATGSKPAGAAALVLGILLAYFGVNLFGVAIGCSAVALLITIIL